MKTCASVFCVLLAFAAGADNLIQNGDFAADGKDVGPSYRAEGGTFAVFTETPSWNRCGKYVVGKPMIGKDGTRTTLGCVLCGDAAAKRPGVPVDPEATYAFSFEIMGNIPQVRLSLEEFWNEGDPNAMHRSEPSVTWAQPKSDGWRQVKGTVRTSAKARRAVLRFGVYSSSKLKMDPIDEGAWFLVDNVKLEAVLQKAKIDKFKDRKFSIAPVSVTSDFSVPFLPDEVFDPPTNIVLTAAVNEVKPLPLALANLTDAMTQYRVIVETNPEPGKDDGQFGLAGFPSAQISCREALRFKETDVEPVTLRLDPLVAMNEILVTAVPAKEAGLVWVDFDTTGVKPGVYRGRIRVLPLSEPGKWKSGGSFHDRTHEGVGRSIPLTLEVLPVELPKKPVRPICLCGAAETESAYRLMRGLGTSHFAVSPWHFQFDLDADGNMDYSKCRPVTDKARSLIRRHKAFSAKYGDGRPAFTVMYSAWHAMCSVYGLSKDVERAKRLWPQYLKGVRRVMHEEDVRDDEFDVETWDEPPNKIADLVLEAHRIAKSACPELTLHLSLGCAPQHGFEPDNVLRLMPLTDRWMNWRFAYFSRRYADALRKLQEKGQWISHYSCGTSMRDPIHFTFRLTPWFGERHRADCDGLYQFVNGSGGDGRASFKVTTYGDIVYRSFDTFVPSLRYMAIREGQTDLKYLAVLRQLRGDEPAIRQFLDEAPRKVVDDSPHDASVAPKIRAEALRLILEGKGK